jgi:hypothetical protein
MTDPATKTGVVYLFQPGADNALDPIRLKGLDAAGLYRVSFEDGTQPTTVKSGQELMDEGLHVALAGPKASELIFIEVAE